MTLLREQRRPVRGNVTRYAGIVILCIVPVAGRAESVSPANPSPLMIPMPLSVVEPPRDVPAAQWKSPYCGQWEDGCAECIRLNADDKPHCFDRGQCRRHANICFREYDQGYFNTICSIFDEQTFYYNRNFEIYVRSHPFIVEWTYNNNRFKASRHNLNDPDLQIGDQVYKLTEKGFETTPQDGKHLTAEIAPVFEEGVYGIECDETYSKK